MNSLDHWKFWKHLILVYIEIILHSTRINCEGQWQKILQILKYYFFYLKAISILIFVVACQAGRKGRYDYGFNRYNHYDYGINRYNYNQYYQHQGYNNYAQASPYSLQYIQSNPAYNFKRYSYKILPSSTSTSPKDLNSLIQTFG